MITGRRASWMHWYPTRPRRGSEGGRWRRDVEHTGGASAAVGQRTYRAHGRSDTRQEGPARIVTGYDSKRNRRRGEPGNMSGGGQAAGTGARLGVWRPRAVFSPYPFAPPLHRPPLHPSGHFLLHPGPMRGELSRIPQYGIPRTTLPRTPVNRGKREGPRLLYALALLIDTLR